MSEAQSAWNRLQDAGFTIAMPDKDAKFNTDANGKIKPMLAIHFNEKKIKFPCLCQPKYDGVRCTISQDEDGIHIISRKGKPYKRLCGECLLRWQAIAYRNTRFAHGSPHCDAPVRTERRTIAFEVRIPMPVTRAKAITAAEMEAYELVTALDVASFNAGLARKQREGVDIQEVTDHDEFIGWVKNELTKIGI